MTDNYIPGVCETLATLRRTQPLVHSITNYVTVNDCANILIAFGASPIMADEPDEMAEIVSISSGVNINLGTLNRRTIEAMHCACQSASERGLTLTLDPVGVGASSLRYNTALELLKKYRFTAIRGNMSELMTLSRGVSGGQGVDASENDLVSEATIADRARYLRDLAQTTHATVVASGAIDLATDGVDLYGVYNGCASMAQISGSGCMLTAVLNAFLASERLTGSPLSDLLTVTYATSAYGVCGELADEYVKSSNLGSGSLRVALIDAASNLTSDRLMGKCIIQRLSF
ncbi:MAG: hydroxyethylthiazole kinase [Planctomycetia bacterium]|nr:hydroxyethylthiazole kinase [Planctomycetia bacterium]